MSGQGFGSFMEGLQGGISTMQDIRRKKQLDKIYDQEITLGDERVTGRDFSRARAGLDPLKKSKSGDPFLYRLMEKLGRGNDSNESPTAGALPVAAEADPEPIVLSGDYDPSAEWVDPEADVALADAGSVDDAMRRAEELKLEEDTGPKKSSRPKMTEAEFDEKRATASKQTGRASEIRPVEQVSKGSKKIISKVGAEVGEAIPTKAKWYKPSGYGLAAKEGAGVLSKAGRWVGRAAAPLAIGGAAAGGIRGALDTETTGDGFWSDVGQRAVGAGKGVVAGLLNPIDSIFGVGGEEEAAVAPPEEQKVAGSGPRGPRRYPGQGRPASAIPTAPSAPGAAAAGPAEEPNPLDGFDVSKVAPEDIPNFSVKDWESFREENIKELVANGMSYAEAWDKVDQQTVATQQRGFMHFAKQAYMALGKDGKYSPAAAAAVRAAFQYLPSTTDIQVGDYNGHLVAFSIDEETGEQVGTPMVVTPQLLQSAMINFQDPKAWAEHAQDNRKIDQADRELGQGDRRLDLLGDQVGIERENAITNRIKAIGDPGGGPGGSGGMKLSDADRHTQFWQDESFAAAGGDSDLQAAMAAVMSSLYTEDGGNTRPEVISRQVKALAKTEEGRAKIFAAANQYAGG